MNLMQFLISHVSMKRRNPFLTVYIELWVHGLYDLYFLLLSCACWMRRKTERSRTTCGWTCLMKTAVTGWCLWDLLRTTWSRIWWPTSMAQRYFTPQSRTSSPNKNLRSAHCHVLCKQDSCSAFVGIVFYTVVFARTSLGLVCSFLCRVCQSEDPRCYRGRKKRWFNTRITF